MKFKERVKHIWETYFTTASRVLLILFILAGMLHILVSLNAAVAERITVTLGNFMRQFMSLLTGFLPFSLGEILIILSPVAIGLIIFFGIKAFKNKVKLIRYTITVISVISLFYTLYVPTLGVGYKRPTVGARLDFPTVEVNSETLTNTYITLKEECEKRLHKIEFTESGASVSGKSVAELSEAICRGYEALNEEYPELNLGSFSSRGKPVLASRVMTALRITGVYTYFTGEANVNVHFPDYSTPFTTAHELAHQRGYSRENEANFIAFMVCIRSGDPYVEYSGYISMLEYISSALNKTDKDAYKSLYSTLDSRIKGEFKAYSEFYYANENVLLGNLSNFINDKYLKSQGTEGIVSYGLVVKLCVAYYNGEVGQ